MLVVCSGIPEDLKDRICHNSKLIEQQKLELMKLELVMVPTVPDVGLSILAIVQKQIRE